MKKTNVILILLIASMGGLILTFKYTIDTNGKNNTIEHVQLAEGIEHGEVNEPDPFIDLIGHQINDLQKNSIQIKPEFSQEIIFLEQRYKLMVADASNENEPPNDYIFLVDADGKVIYQLEPVLGVNTPGVMQVLDIACGEMLKNGLTDIVVHFSGSSEEGEIEAFTCYFQDEKGFTQDAEINAQMDAFIQEDKQTTFNNPEAQWYKKSKAQYLLTYFTHTLPVPETYNVTEVAQSYVGRNINELMDVYFIRREDFEADIIFRGEPMQVMAFYRPLPFTQSKALFTIQVFLVDGEGQIQYRLENVEGFSDMNLTELKEIAVVDINEDGLLDIIVDFGYMSGIGSHGAYAWSCYGVYFQNEDSFTQSGELNFDVTIYVGDNTYVDNFDGEGSRYEVPDMDFVIEYLQMKL